MMSLGALWLACMLAHAAERPAPVTALQFSPDGTSLVSSGYRGVVVRPAAGGAPPRTLPCELSQVQALQFSPDGSKLAVGGGSPGEKGAVVLLDWAGGKPRRTLSGHRDLVTSVAYSPDGKRLATGSADATVRVWDLGAPADSAPRSLEGHAGPILSVAFSPDGALIVTASADRSVKVWNAKTGGLERSLTNHTDVVNCVSFRSPAQGITSPHPYCVTASDDRTLRVWQPGIGRMVRIIRGSRGSALAACYSRDGKRIYAAGTEGLVRVIDAESDEIQSNFKAAEGWVYCLALSPDGSRLATGDWQGNVRQWDLTKPEMPLIPERR